ncbi:carbonic anhydrase [Reinekea blandensis]|uniref:Putative carbonic anhydrase n=1 Tax=Reinekea blandensis MED297 TaxID=314283 RepID=A4BGP7_9GAMM|nr:carbonic anhydrase [Reinekea blandensis]EAR08695.1 putative carbonic anhydrase [Reinekea sp. MED297] [Reinekea blandensis MED297]
MITATEALDRLKTGNRRFVEGRSLFSEMVNEQRREKLVTGQNPWAVILGCSDSRAPAEILFDLGLGDLFVIRVAGNVVAPSGVGSIEFAVESYGTPLVVVLGHTNCGAIQATLDTLAHPEQAPSTNLNSIVSRIRPSVETLMETDLVDQPETLAVKAMRANVRTSVSQIRHSSPMLEQRVQSGRLKVVGAQYSLASGEVEFFC